MIDDQLRTPLVLRHFRPANEAIRVSYSQSVKAAISIGRSISARLVILLVGQDDTRANDELRLLKAGLPGIPLLVVARTFTGHDVVQILRSGAHGYVGYEAALTELDAAIGSLIHGGRYIS